MRSSGRPERLKLAISAVTMCGPMRSRSMEAIWEALQAVKDPEIPTISVVELGLIRQVGYEGTHLIVVMTPSFVGCPALDVMRADIREHLADSGIDQVEVRVTHKPPWSSDWITSAGRDKLKLLGLAPPPLHGDNLASAIEQAARCPYCASTETELKNSFGSTLCRSIYFCKSCSQPFEQFKPL